MTASEVWILTDNIMLSVSVDGEDNVLLETDINTLELQTSLSLKLVACSETREVNCLVMFAMEEICEREY